jgi:dipeptidyl aminopeptidase/acylaminoacyl peptidase
MPKCLEWPFEIPIRPKQLIAASAISFVDRVRIPILLGHGNDDSNVHVNQSKKMARALRKAGKEVELAIYDDEIHGHQVSGTASNFYARLEEYFAKTLAPAP